jgi:phosphoserine aminotransferase
VEKQDRSKMNVVFRIQGDNEPLEKQCIEEASAAGLSGLKGHRSVGGLRASIYNAHPVEGVQALVDFLQSFEQKHG